jgi:hypothetical protein
MFLLRKQNVRLISWKALRPTYQSIRSLHAMCLMSAKTGLWNRSFKSVPKCRSTFLFCAPVIPYRQQRFDLLVFCPRSPTDLYKQSYWGDQWYNLGHAVLYGTEDGKKASNTGAWGSHRTTFKEFWQVNLKEGERLKNPDKYRSINWQ